jgi:predicted TIM-barrel fold metal-dependent hydrolase
MTRLGGLGSGSIDWVVSVDDHVLEPAHTWTDRLPAKYREAGPRLITDDRGEAWVYEDRRIPTLGLAATAGQSKDELSPAPIPYSAMRPGCYDATARIEDMDLDGVLASACFPSVPRFCGQLFYEGHDHELGMLCVKAWNDWMIDEWSASAPGRFIPLTMIPLWDPREAAREIQRCAGKGAKGVIFSENPSKLGLPSIHDANRYWDPVFEAAEQLDMPICTHIGSSSSLPTTSPDAPSVISVALNPIVTPQFTCVDWLLSGLFFRFPKLKLCLSEGGIGWVPHVLNWLDHVADTQRWARTTEFKMDYVKADYKAVAATSEPIREGVMPSQLFREHVYGCFIADTVGVRNLDLIGEDNVMVETDYPHSDSNWPNSLQNIRKELAPLTPDQQHKVAFSNACRLFNFEPASPPEATASAN